MLTEALDYSLPESLIAQSPSPQRDESRLMVVDRDSDSIQLDSYKNIAQYLKRGDTMVLNDSRVIRARLHGHKSSGGRVELFLLQEIESACWIALVRPSAKVKPGTTVHFSGGLDARVDGWVEGGKRKVYFNDSEVIERLEGAGQIPLPPYIKREKEDRQDAERYQTVYARIPGAVAAPTAGLHFTDRVFHRLDQLGVGRVSLTLHVGYGTFKPITATSLEEHRVDAEEYDFPEIACKTLNKTRESGGRIVAVGTTCARVLETQFSDGSFRSGSGTTSLYIKPPYQFQGVDILQTNFHLPRSSLLALVCAFGGYELIMEAYRRAVDEKFRFYSYGDVMLIR